MSRRMFLPKRRGGLKEKLDELTRAAVIGLVSGDSFDVGNGGEAKLQVKITGFVTGVSDTAAAAEQETTKSGLDVKGLGVPYDKNNGYDTSGVTGENYTGVTTTTIYIAYGGVTWYGGGPSCLSIDEETPPTEKSPDYVERSGFAGVAKAAGDENNYYIKVVGLSGEAEYILVGDLAKLGSDPKAFLNAKVANIVGNSMEDYGKLADTIIVATDPEGNNIVMTIKLKDGTAKLEELPSTNEPAPPKEEVPGSEELTPLNEPGNDGNAAPEAGSGEGGTNKASGGYNDPEKVGRDLQYTPNPIVDVDHTAGENTADVTVRDTIIAPDPNAPDIS